MLGGRYLEERRTLLAAVVVRGERRPRRSARAQRSRRQSRLAGQHDRVRGRDRRPLRLRDARRRHHRRHAHRLHRLCAVRRRPDPRSAARVVPAGAGGAARAHPSAHRHFRRRAHRHHRAPRAATPASTATARRTSRWPKATASMLSRAPHAARFLHPEGHDYFAMLREKLHWSETPERLSEIRQGVRTPVRRRRQALKARLLSPRCCACCRSAISSSSMRSTSSSAPASPCSPAKPARASRSCSTRCRCCSATASSCGSCAPGAERAELAAEFDVDRRAGRRRVARGAGAGRRRRRRAAAPRRSTRRDAAARGSTAGPPRSRN